MVANGPKSQVITRLGHRMLRALSLISLLACAFALPASAENVKGDIAVLRALDKVTATTKDYSIVVGETLKYGSLEITVRHCEKHPPEEIPEVYVFMQVLEPGKALKEDEKAPDPDVEFDENPEKLF